MEQREEAGSDSGQHHDRTHSDEVEVSDDGNQNDGAGYSHGQEAGHDYGCSSHHARGNRCDEVVANENDSVHFEGLRPESVSCQWESRVWGLGEAKG